jgi:hypothetical protein
MAAGKSKINRPRKKWKEVHLALRWNFGRILITVKEGKEED